MLIDWFTVAAQVVNFCILLVLLKKFLYTPLVRAMDKREEKMQQERTATAQARDEAIQEKMTLKAMRVELEQSREGFLSQARKDAAAQYAQDLRQARLEVEASRQEWLREIDRERERLQQRLRETMAQQLLLLTKKTMKMLAGSDLTERILEVFFHNLKQHLKKKPVDIAAPPAPLVLVTGFPLDPSLEQRTRSRLAETLPGECTFRVDPAIGPGVRLLIGHERFSWDLDHQMKEMELAMMKQFASYATKEKNDTVTDLQKPDAMSAERSHDTLPH